MAKGQTQTLYSLAAVLGLVESGNKEDPFHMIVYRISGKTSVRELTPPEAAAVEAELRRQLREQRPKKKAASPEYPGKMHMPGGCCMIWQSSRPLRCQWANAWQASSERYCRKTPAPVIR